MTDRELAGCALLPCPGCRGSDCRVIGGPGTAGGPQYWAGCMHCRWRAWGNTEAEAIAAWNRRTPSSEGDGGDGERLMYLAKDGCVEGFVHVKADIYDYACDAAEESGRDEPNDADMLSGIRRLVDAAIAAAARNQGTDQPE